MAPVDTDRNLLFGLLALQNGLIDQPALLRGIRRLDARQGPTSGRSPCRPRPPRCSAAWRRRGHRRPASPGSRRRSRQEPWRTGRRTRDSRRSRTGRRTGRRDDPRICRIRDRLYSRRRWIRRHCELFHGLGHLRRPAVPHPRPHARGGLGAVFVALDWSLTARSRSSRSSTTTPTIPISRFRFLVEAEITGGLEHPGIVPVYGLGTYDDGRPYYAMRFIRGDQPQGSDRPVPSARRATEQARGQVPRAEPLLASQPAHGSRDLELRKLLRRFIDVCNAIEYAHSRGVLHRDIKPAQHHSGQARRDAGRRLGAGQAAAAVEPATAAASGC